MRFATNAGLTLILVTAALTVLTAGCDKERIVKSTEYVHDIKYVESPPDTIVVRDTMLRTDSVFVNKHDTVRIADTVRITNTVLDTIVVNHTILDTVVLTNMIHDTIRVTSIVHDTVLKAQCTPSTQMAVDAMISQADPMLLEFLMQQVGQNDGWVFHLSPSQMNVTQVSTSVWDIYSVADYWAVDWSGYYQIEMLWRMTFNGGDASNPANWSMGEPPASPRFKPGLNILEQSLTVRPSRMTPLD